MKTQVPNPSSAPLNIEVASPQRQDSDILAFVEAERDFLANVYRMLEMKRHDDAKEWLSLHLGLLGTWALDLQG